jgi:ribosomal protein S27E
MPENVRCQSCATTLLGFESLGPKPVGTDECPNCGGTNFVFADQ